MTVAATGTERSTGRRWMAAALFASLALNLVVVGATAGFLWRHSGQGPGAHRWPPNLLNYTATLPAERQKELAARVAAQRANVRPLRRQLRAARDEVASVLAVQPFDKQRFEAVQAQLMVADQRAREAVYQLYAEIAANMTPEERRGFAEWRQQRPMKNLLDEPQTQVSDHPR